MKTRESLSFFRMGGPFGFQDAGQFLARPRLHGPQTSSNSSTFGKVHIDFGDPTQLPVPRLFLFWITCSLSCTLLSNTVCAMLRRPRARAGTAQAAERGRPEFPTGPSPRGPCQRPESAMFARDGHPGTQRRGAFRCLPMPFRLCIPEKQEGSPGQPGSPSSPPHKAWSLSIIGFFGGL